MKNVIPKNVIKKLKEIRLDCIKLGKQNTLSDFGKGELHIIRLIEEYLCHVSVVDKTYKV